MDELIGAVEKSACEDEVVCLVAKLAKHYIAAVEGNQIFYLSAIIPYPMSIVFLS